MKHKVVISWITDDVPESSSTKLVTFQHRDGSRVIGYAAYVDGKWETAGEPIIEAFSVVAWANVDPYPGSFDNVGLTFGQAVEAMRVGAVVTRPGLGFDVHLLRECCIHTHSSPDPVIQKYSNQGVPLITAMPAFRTVGLNNTKNGIDLATATGWIPTTEDILATNWEMSQR